MTPAATVAAEGGQPASQAAELSRQREKNLSPDSATASQHASPASVASSLPALVRASLLPSGAHLERCYSVCCTDTHVFVGGGSIAGVVCVWKLPGDLLRAFAAQHGDGDTGEATRFPAKDGQTPDRAEWEFVGVLGPMVSPVVQLKLNSTRERLAAATQTAIGYIWDVSPAALASLSQLTASAHLSLSVFASLTSPSSVPSWLGDVFAADPSAASNSSLSPTALPPAISDLLRLGPKPVAVLGGAESPANVTCVEFLPDGCTLAAGSGLPLSVDQVGREDCVSKAPLGIYHCESGHRLAEFPAFVFSPDKKASHAARAPLLLSSIATVAMDPHKFLPPPLPSTSSSSSSSAASSRWLAAGDAVCGCTALVLLPDGLLMQLRRQHESLLHAWNQKETRRLALLRLRRRRDEALASAAQCTEAAGDDANSAEAGQRMQREQDAADAEKAYQTALAEAEAAGDTVKDRDEEDETLDERKPMPPVQPALLHLPTVVAQLSEAAPAELNPVPLHTSSQHTLHVRSIVLCKVASGSSSADVRSLVCLRPYSRRGHVTVAACNAFDFPSFASFASLDPSGFAAAFPGIESGKDASEERSKADETAATASSYQVRYVEGLGEAGDEIATCIHTHADFICGVAASPSGLLVVSLAADKSLVVYIRSEAARERLKKEEEERKRREAEEARRMQAIAAEERTHAEERSHAEDRMHGEERTHAEQSSEEGVDGSRRERVRDELAGPGREDAAPSAPEESSAGQTCRDVLDDEERGSSPKRQKKDRLPTEGAEDPQLAHGDEDDSLFGED
ncbi:conserved hypothetical protein [Neospora caninum Liverpool]|uniref:WD domain, G-beta repeat-containing protein n=1 Tax=Neospora caninum (strain Liverpool) TaxID=572307 RepID=F0VN63_NEOCL|nr:conserved hypothetical protein [Neospora caninum Liverpool]CBZ55159.1 conserved hypothetical protein [Neospora caninum Liverpool]|eukprot:XP_003885187.1 conserved hypothetical protein [Neospora caninum Liverpool]